MTRTFLVLLFLITFEYIFAQSSNGVLTIKDRGRISFAISNNNPKDLGDNIKCIGFFYLNEKLTDVVFEYEKQKPDLTFSLDTNIVIFRRGFDLTNAGDSILFRNYFPNLRAPHIPNVNNETLLGALDTAFTFNIYKILQYRDSTVYTYFRGTEFGHGFSSLIHAKFDGNFDEFKNNLKKRIHKLKSHEVLYSPVIYEAIVSKKGDLEDTKLIFGDKTIFSELIKKSLEDAKWSPAFQSSTGMLCRVKVRIYVKLNEDGELIIKLPNKIYNSTGH